MSSYAATAERPSPGASKSQPQSLGAATTEPCAPQQEDHKEKPALHSSRVAPHFPQLEKAHVQQQDPV